MKALLEELYILTAKDPEGKLLKEALEYMGAVLYDNSDGERMLFRYRMCTLKVSRFRKQAYYGNFVENYIWDMVKGKPLQNMFNPVLGMTPDKRILVSPYQEVVLSPTPEAQAHIDRMIKVYDMYLATPRTTSADLSLQVHYPYVHRLPSILK